MDEEELLATPNHQDEIEFLRKENIRLQESNDTLTECVLELSTMLFEGGELDG